MNTNTDQEPDSKRYDNKYLRILQINLNKSPAAHFELLNGNLAKKWDIVLMQEPHRNYYNSIATARGYRQVYPTAKAREAGEPRSAIWMNERLDTGSWNELNIADSPDITAVKIKGEFGALTIFNIYNDCEHDSTTTTLQKYLEDHEDELYGDGKHVIWAGDFNRHHRLWDNDEDSRLFTAQATEQAKSLIYMMSEWDMTMALPKGIRTLRHMRTKNESRPDNVFCDELLMDRIIACNVRLPERCPNTDHYPIATIIDVDKDTRSARPRPNFKETDWGEFRTLLQTKIDADEDLMQPITGEAQFNERVEKLTGIIQDTIHQQVPRSKPTSYARRWWNRELGAMREEKEKLLAEAWKQRAIPDHPTHEKLRKFMAEYAKAIIEAKKAHWVGFLTEADTAALWLANRYLNNPVGDGPNARLPPLETKKDGRTITVLTNEDKARTVGEAFFTKPPANNPEIDQRQHEYPPALAAALPITPKRIIEHAKKLAAHKAPGIDEIPNAVLKECAPTLAPPLAIIYNAVFELGVYHQNWKDSITCVLRKPGKPSYQNPKAYRPIALLSTIGKLLSAIVADDMSRIIEENELLPATHFGGRPKRTTTDALHHLVNRIKMAWKKKKVVSVLFLDVEGAFPNAVSTKVIHNMKKRRIPEVYVNMMANLLNGRRTKLRFDDFISEFIEIENGIGQGCPLSMVIYILYNADIIEIPQDDKEGAVGYVDDIALVAEGKTLEETTERLKDMMERRGGGLEWSKTHNSRFEMSKVAIMHFTRKSDKNGDGTSTKWRHKAPPLVLQGTEIKVVETYKYLGVLMDPELRWKDQAEKAVTKGIKWVGLFKRLSRTRSGINSQLMRQLYRAVGIPKVTYAAEIWYTPPEKREGSTKRTGSVSALKKLQSMQRQAALAITGAMRTTASDILDVHANLIPIEILLTTSRKRAYIRICTLPTTHALNEQADDAYENRTRRPNEPAPMETMARKYDIVPSDVEKIGRRARAPTFKHVFDTEIETGRQESIDKEQEDEAHIRVYTDGSAIGGKVGAAALMYHDDEEEPREILHYHLGPKTKYSTYDAEWVGLLMATWLLTWTDDPSIGQEKARVYVDNQSVIRMATSLTPGPGQHLRDATIDIAEELRNRGPLEHKFTIRWISAHSEVERNERVDKEAKLAAEGKTSELRRLPAKLHSTLPHSVSALVQNAKEEAKAKWKRDWTKSDRNKRYSKIDNQFPPKRFLDVTRTLHKDKASDLMQIRTERIPLNAHLHKIGKADNPKCPKCRTGRRETVEHFLFECPNYRKLRQKMNRAHKTARKDLRQIFESEQHTKVLLRYVANTKRLANTYTMTGKTRKRQDE